MIDLSTYIYEGIFDDDVQMDRIDQTVTGFTQAMDALSKPMKFRGSDISGILRNLEVTEKFGIYYRAAKSKSFEDAEKVFMNVIKTLTSTKEGEYTYDLFKYFHRIIYNHFNEMWEYQYVSDSRIGMGPDLKKGFNPHIKDELREQGFKHFDNAIIWLAWSDWTSPSSKYMLKTIKEMDKDETEFMITLMKLLKNKL